MFTLETTKNTRDLGCYHSKSGFAFRENQLIRSEVADQVTVADLKELSARNIYLCIDLRTPRETQQRRNALLDVPGMTVKAYTIPGGEIVPKLPEEVAPNYLRMTGETKAMREIFHSIAEAQCGVIFCCNAGKDRTGIVSSLLLLAAGADDETIIQDYARTAEGLKSDLEWYADFAGIPLEIVWPHEGYMREFLMLFRKKYGTIDGYFLQLGLTQEEVVSLKQRLNQTGGYI